jgi:hypothetical protein
MPRPVLVSFDRLLARKVLDTKSAPWVFCTSRSGQEPGTQVFMYVAELRAVVGTYTAGTVFEYTSLAGLKEGINASEIQRFGEDDIDQGWIEDVFAWQPRGWAVDVCDPRAFTPHLVVGDTTIGNEVTGPDGFRYLDLENPEDATLWSQAQQALSVVGAPDHPRYGCQQLTFVTARYPR